MQLLRTLLRNLLRLARHALYAAAVKRWPELRQEGRSVKLSELAAKLLAQRELRSATQRAAAEQCGIHTSLYGRLERGKEVVNTIEVLQKVCKWLGINPREIDYEMDTLTPRYIHVGVPACDSRDDLPAAHDAAGPDRGSGAEEQ
jgi:transcriptional regulator with XRE-family HTH domain